MKLSKHMAVDKHSLVSKHIAPILAAALLVGAAGMARGASIDLRTYYPGANDGSQFVSGVVETGYSQSSISNMLTVITGPNLPTGTESTHNDFFPFTVGDFTTQVTVAASPNTVGQLYADFFSGGYAGIGYSNGSSFGQYGFGDQNIRTGDTPASSPVVLRLSRSGDTFTAGFFDAGSGGFRTVTQLTGSNVTGQFGMDLSVYGFTGQSAPGSVVYSNFNIVHVAPTDVSLAGGAADAPTALGSGVSSVSGDIGGDAGTADFYSFNWQGGLFSAIGDVLHASEPNYYDFQLCSGAFCSAGKKLSDVVLDGGNSWRDAISASLAPGLYTIGLTQNGTGPDPTFNIIFATPAAIPEPTTWAMMLVGFGGLGAMLRRAKRYPSARSEGTYSF